MNRSALITCFSALGLGFIKKNHLGSSARLTSGYELEFKFYLNAKLLSPIAFKNYRSANRMWGDYILPLRPVDLRKILDKNGLEGFNVFVLDYLDDSSEDSNLIIDFIFETAGVYVARQSSEARAQGSEERYFLSQVYFSKMRNVIEDIIDLLNKHDHLGLQDWFLSVEDVTLERHWTDEHREIIIDLGTGKEYERPKSRSPKLRKR